MAGFAAALVGLSAELAVAAGDIVPCDTIGIEVEIDPTWDPMCVAGITSNGEFRSDWEYIQLHADDRFIAVSIERAGRSSVIYRPRLEQAVEDHVDLGGDPEKIEWTTGIADERFRIRRFKITTTTNLLPCAGFLETNGQFLGPDVKFMFYGYFCNLNGLAFADGEIVNMLSQISY